MVLSYRLFDSKGTCIVEDGLRTMLPHGMVPDEAAEIELRVMTPTEPGCYAVAAQFVRERVAWFGEAPSVTLQVGQARVRRRRSQPAAAHGRHLL